MAAAAPIFFKPLERTPDLSLFSPLEEYIHIINIYKSDIDGFQRRYAPQNAPEGLRELNKKIIQQRDMALKITLCLNNHYLMGCKEIECLSDSEYVLDNLLVRDSDTPVPRNTTVYSIKSLFKMDIPKLLAILPSHIFSADSVKKIEGSPSSPT